jgi:cytochrome c biogenesis protein CcmG, thiol:disulfide interchange protein DsbE
MTISVIVFAKDSKLKGPWTTLDGKPMVFFQDGKPLLLDFWASWCIPCRQAVTELNEISEDIPSLRIVGVNTDDPGNFEGAKHFMRVTKMSYPTIVDMPEQISNPLHVDGLPTLILFNAKGKEIKRWVGAPESLRQEIQDALKAKR